MNFNVGATAELKKLIIPIMSHLPVMMIVAYRTLPRMRYDQRQQTRANQQPGGFCFVLFFWLQNNTAEPRYKKKWIGSRLIILWKNVGNF